MYQPLEPITLASQVAWEVVGPVGAAGAAGIVALWRRVVVLTDRGREDTREILPAIRDVADALNRLSEADSLNRLTVADAVKQLTAASGELARKLDEIDKRIA